MQSEAIRVLGDLISWLQQWIMNDFNWNDHPLICAYYYLLPRNCRTIEGKRRVYTLPAKIFTPRNFKHSWYVATKCAHSSIRCFEEMAVIWGNISFTKWQSKVLVELTVAKKKAPIIINTRCVARFGTICKILKM